MNFSKFLIIAVLFVIYAENSIITKKNLLQPRQTEACFTCKAEERPFAWPFVSLMGKLRDAFVKSLNGLLAKTKDLKLA